MLNVHVICGQTATAGSQDSVHHRKQKVEVKYVGTKFYRTNATENIWDGTLDTTLRAHFDLQRSNH